MSFALWGLAACVGLAALAGCTTTGATYLDVQSDHLRHKTVVIVDSFPQPPLNEVQHRTIVTQMQQRLMALPYLGQTITPQQFLQRTEGNYSLRNDYQIYADTLSSVGVSDQELARSLGAATGAELLMNVQAYYVPCSYCTDGNSAYLVTQFIEAKTGTLLLRIDLRAHPGPSDRALGEAFLSLEEEMVDEVRLALTPRAHIERFRHLKELHEKAAGVKS